MRTCLAALFLIAVLLPMNFADDCTAPRLSVLGGHDVIAYRQIPPGSSAVKGRATHMTTFAGYTFLFVDAANMELFDSDPVRFIPAW